MRDTILFFFVKCPGTLYRRNTRWTNKWTIFDLLVR